MQLGNRNYCPYLSGGQATIPFVTYWMLCYITHLKIEPDELHIMHLGYSMYMLGLILYMLVFQVLSDAPQANMELVLGQVVEY